VKKIIPAMATGILLILETANGASAQSENNVKVFDFRASIIKAEKLLTQADQLQTADTINTKALIRFKKLYGEASGVKWFDYNSEYTAEFASNGINTQVYYSKKGQWQASVKNYSEDLLDQKLKDIVKSRYYDYSIFHVQEIESLYSNGIPTYLIYIENNHEFRVLRLCDEVLDVYKQLNKQS
jgi:hypothetical protein